jgi:hypothetical protein
MRAARQYYILPMRLEVLIDGMMAVHARHAAFTALAAVPGIVRAEVEPGRAVLECPDGSEAAIREALAEVGLSVRAIRVLPRSLPVL